MTDNEKPKAFKPGVGKTEAVDIFAEAMKLSEEEAAKLQEHDSESAAKRGVGKTEAVDIFAAVRDFDAKAELETEGEAASDKKTVRLMIIKDIIIHGGIIAGTELLLSLIISACFALKIIPSGSIGIIAGIGASFILFTAFIIMWSVRSVWQRGIIANLMSYSILVVLSLMIWVLGSAVKKLGMTFVSWIFMPMKLFRVSIFHGLGEKGNLYSILMSHLIIFGMILFTYLITRKLAEGK